MNISERRIRVASEGGGAGLGPPSWFSGSTRLSTHGINPFSTQKSDGGDLDAGPDAGCRELPKAARGIRTTRFRAQLQARPTRPPPSSRTRMLRRKTPRLEKRATLVRAHARRAPRARPRCLQATTTTTGAQQLPPPLVAAYRTPTMLATSLTSTAPSRPSRPVRARPRLQRTEGRLPARTPPNFDIPLQQRKMTSS